MKEKLINNMERHIIEDKYYIDIFNAITDYLRENPDEFRYEGDYYDQYRYELGLHDYKLLELFYEINNGIKTMSIIVEANIAVFDLEDIGLDRTITEKLHIEVNADSDCENLKVVYVGKCLFTPPR